MNLSKPQKLIYDMERVVGGSISVICGSMLFSGVVVDTSKIEQAINEIYRINDAFRIRIAEQDGKASQTIVDYAPRKIEVLQFENKTALDDYAAEYAKIPLDFFGDLSEFKIVLLPNCCGVLAKTHHIIGDAWTLSLIGNQINALLRGDKPEAYSYVDYLETEKAYLHSKRYEKDRSFFIDQFKRFDDVYYLSEKQNTSATAGRKTFVISATDAKKVVDYAKANNTSAFILFTAAFAVYMNRVKMNAERFYLGTAMLNRATEKEKSTAGMFVNTVPMLIELSNNQSFIENLSRIEDAALSAFRHQKYNYGDVLSDLRREYNFGEKLYDVIISYQNATVLGDAVKTTWYPCACQVESLQIHIDDRDNEGVFRIHYDYLIEKFSEQEIEMLHIHLLNLLFNAFSDDHQKIYELSMLTADEEQKLFVDFNDTAKDYPKDKCVHTLFEEQTARTPDKVAVIACDKTLTYRELNEEANRIAHSLIERGVGVGNIVAFALPRRSYLISAIFGILKTGAAYLPVDPDYPQERIEYMLKDSHAGYIISESNIKELLSKSNANAPNIKLSSNNYCYCIYTSGSTGMPKGVEITHANVCNFVQENNKNHFQKLLLDSCEVIVGINSIVFDIVLQETLLPLVNGKTIFFLSEEEIAHIGGTSDSFNNKPCGLIITPSRLSLFMEDLYFCNNLNNFKVIMCGAEPFPEKLVESIKNYTNAQIINGYGPTETTCGVTYCNIENNYDITIGKPIANTQIYIVDLYLNPTPIGVIGEICIAGDGVGVGYLNRPELTAEKFIDNPFGKGKLYKTGDLAYWRDDGNIVYVGRNDFQVKIRGLRIELGEIENALSSLEGVNQSVVIVRKDDHDRQLICCFYTGKELDTKEIRSAIGKKLPKYMLPHIITHVSEMPLTPSGKINRKALPDIDLSHIKNTTEYIAPVTEREKMVARILASILEVERIGLTDDFFELGCDSLKAIEFISACHYEGIYFNLQSVFDHPTISSLLQAVDTVDCKRMQYDASDFEIINQLIAKNTVETIPVPSETSVGNIMLAGATGYLGAHILSDYLDHDTGTAYCIVRGERTGDCERRLHEILRFYFDDTYIGNNRIVVLRGDLTKERFGLSDEDYQFLLRHVDTVINSVASVKHYGSYAFFHETNVQTVEHLIDFCQASDAKLIHISTTSVAGNDFDNQISSNTEIADEKLFAEHDLYIGQPLDNVYVRSKFEAEKTVLIAMSEGLKANIMRMGNLTSRRSDGRFQKNYDTNAFLKRIKALVELGCIPDYLLGLYTEFTPIDDAASAVMTITRHFRSDRNLFHVENTNPISFRELYDDLNEIGISMKAVDAKTFGALLRGTENDLKTKHIYETFIQDIGDDDRLHYDSPIRIDTRFSDAYLRSLGFAWHKTDLEYITKYFAYLKAIQYIV